MFVLQCLIISLLCAISGNAFPLFGRYSYPIVEMRFLCLEDIHTLCLERLLGGIH